jgi:lipopolysaccharide/colanic/teichoic acid biosynthesis glycosyltransferase
MGSIASFTDRVQDEVRQSIQPFNRQATSVRYVPEMVWSLSGAKRATDVVVSIAVLSVFALPMLLIALCVRLTSRGPALFRQDRVGRGGRIFNIYKFRSMAEAAECPGPGLTKCGDARITPFGRWMRALKLDELPQFINVLRGDMSIVGPRPKLSRYADSLDLTYWPGITGAASLAFRHEEQILARVPAGEVDDFYENRIKPIKARIDERYMAQATLHSDLRIIAATLIAAIFPAHYPALSYEQVLDDAYWQPGASAHPRKSPDHASVRDVQPVVPAVIMSGRSPRNQASPF